MTEYEYRPMERALPDGEWKQIWTRGSAGYRAYRTRGGAKGVLSYQQRRRNSSAIWDRSRGREPVLYEYKLQQRPKGDWQDVE